MNDDDHLPDSHDSGPVTIREDGDTGDRFVVYVSKDDVRAELRVVGDTFWATQAQMAHMFGVDVRTVSEHVQNIFRDGELAADSVVRESRITAADGKTYRTNLYSLDVIIAVGYRVSSRLGTMFRIWATQVLMTYLTKGFVIDDERLRNLDGKPDFFDELLDRIRDIQIKLRDLIKLDGRPLKPWGAATPVSHARAAAHASREIKAYKDQRRLKAENAGEDQLRQIAKTLKDKKWSK